MKKLVTTTILALAMTFTVVSQTTWPVQRIPMPGSSKPSGGFCGSLVFRDAPSATSTLGTVNCNIPNTAIDCIDSKNKPVPIINGTFTAIVGRRYYFSVKFYDCPPKGTEVTLLVTFQ